MSIVPAWRDKDREAFQSVWLRFQRDIRAIHRECGLSKPRKEGISINFRVPRNREVYEIWIADQLSLKRWERFQHLSDGKFSISACRAAFYGFICEWCGEKFSERGTCVECMSTPEGRKDHYQRVLKRRTEANLARWGVANSFQREEVKEKIRDAFRKQDPEGKATNPMHLEVYRRKHQEAIDRVDEVAKKEKAMQTYLRNWGKKHWMSSDRGKRRFKRAVQALYGVDNIMHDPMYRKKHRELMQDLFADEDWLAWWKSQVSDGAIRKYGVDNVFKAPEIIDKIQSVMLDRYGAKHALQVKRFMGEYWKTCIEKYGCHPMNVPEIRQRQLESLQKTRFAFKKVRVAGKVFLVQGYEEFVLNRLVRKFSVDDIIAQPKKGIGLSNGRRFYPDFYIKSRKTYVEVKSNFTFFDGQQGYGFEFKRNKHKAKEANRIGKKVRWMIAFPKEDVIVHLPKHWYKKSIDDLRDFVSHEHKQILEERAS